MSKAFGKNNGRPNRVKRNSIDGSFQTNGSYNYGALYPVLCKEALPGDSFEIDITAALRAMPFVFPVQTRQRVEFNAFYVRNRNLWKDWPDFISKTKEGLVSPFISHTSPTDISTGSLADYLGLPTTIVGSGVSSEISYPLNKRSRLAFFNYNAGAHSTPLPVPSSWSSPLEGDGIIYDSDGFSSNPALPSDSPYTGGFMAVNVLTPTSVPVSALQPHLSVTLSYPSSSYLRLDSAPSSSSAFKSGSSVIQADSVHLGACLFLTNSSYKDTPGHYIIKPFKSISAVPSSMQTQIQFPNNQTIDFELPDGHSYSSAYFFLVVLYSLPSSASGDYSLNSVVAFESSTTPTTLSVTDYSLFQPVEVSSGPFVNPYRTTAPTDPQLNVSALPFRAYEQIYNAFYRDDRNNPLIINGQPEYNKYLVNTDGGSDSFEYKLRYRNWEQDCYTTALPSPQQGIAPLVGISSTGAMTFSDPDSGESYTVQAKLADDADTIVGAEFTENVPNSVARSIVNYATSGISINDFRNVNAFQRWLETNIRRGMKYRDQIKSHFDVDVRYDELDMPEFIGGTSIDINMNTISQTSESSTDGNGWSSALGSYAGNGFAVGRGKHTIKHYCDEHGFIMIIMSIIPVPNYSQTLEKFWLKTDALDYFFPEFGHIGLQAIPNKLLSPLQAAQVSSSAMDATFGYQRPWYEYLENRDEVHGLLRTQLRNFVLNRVFNGVPTLNEDFLLIDPKQMDEAFSVTDITDKWVGQIYFDIKMKRPIPLYGVPRLESDI